MKRIGFCKFIILSRLLLQIIFFIEITATGDQHGQQLPTISPVQANQLAKNLADEIFAARHQAILDSLHTPATIDAVTKTRADLIETQSQVVKKLEEKISNNPHPPSTSKKNPSKDPFVLLEAVSKKLAKLQALSVNDYLNEIDIQLRKQQGADTISVKIDDNALYVAGNIRSRQLQKQPSDPSMFEFLALKEGNKRMLPFNYDDFGLSELDSTAIAKAVKNSEVGNILADKNAFIVNNADDPTTKATLDDKFRTEDTKLKDTRDQELASLKKQKNKLGEVEYNARVNQIEAAYETKKRNIGTFKEAIYHAEMQHLLHSENFQTSGKSVLGTSKPLCEKCEDAVKKFGKFDYEQNGVGLSADKVTNWERPSTVDAIEIKLDLNKPSTSTRPASPSVDTPSGEGTSKDHAQIKRGESCRRARRRRRSAFSGCIFVMGDLDNGKPAKVSDIDTDAFMKTYSSADSQDKLRLSKLAEASSNAKLVGGGDQVNSVSRIISHEKMKGHNNLMSSATDSVKTGSLDADSIKNAKVSPSKTRLKLSKGLSKLTKNAGKVSGSLGKFLLAKSVVQGIASGDVTGLAIMGGRIGGELALELGSKFGAKVASKVAAKAGTKLGIKATAKVVGKSFSFLSKAAGPIGAIADIGLSAWSLASAVKRLNAPGATKWEQNEAIADIVGESLDIAITAVTTIASIAFPPLAPLFAVIGFFASLFVTAAVTLYKAQNHVDMLNSKLPLLDFEKDREFGRHLIGQDTSAYITNLIQTKFANNLAVNASIAFLEQNPDIIGHVFPSRTIELEGGCQLKRHHCRSSLGELCFSWDDPNTVAWNCYKDAECLDDKSRTCVTKSRVWETWNFPLPSTLVSMECDCKGQARTNFGYPVSNQYVDLREKQWVYPDRSVPDPPYHYNYEELCRPSSLGSKGYRISQSNSQLGYLCEGAIAIRRRSRSGKYMLFDLEGGTDTVYLDGNDRTSNRFIVGEGRKEFVGGGGEDLFVVSDKCTNLRGKLDGGRGRNSLAIENKCASGERLEIDTASQVMRIGGHEAVKIENMEVIYGREGKGDNIRVGCRTNFVAGGGGRTSGDRDLVNLSSDSCYGSSGLTIAADDYTSVGPLVSQNRDTLVVIGKDSKDVVVEGEDNGRQNQRKPTVLVQRGARQLTSAIAYSVTAMKLTFEGYSKVVEVKKVQRVQVLLQENQESPTQVVTSEDKEVLCLHRPESKERNRYGCPSTDNIFQLEGNSGGIMVTGGERRDIFIVGGAFRGRLNGNRGTDELQLSSSLSLGSVSVDLLQGKMDLGGNYVVEVSGIEVVSGRKQKRDVITVDCNTNYVAGNGGASVNQPDEIVIPPGSGNCAHNLTVMLSGQVLLKSSSRQGSLTLFLQNQIATNAKIELALTPRLEASLVLQHPVATITNPSFILRDANRNELSFGHASNTISLKLNFEYYRNREEEYIQTLGISFKEDAGLPSHLLIPFPNQHSRLLAFHSLYRVHNSQKEETRKGASYIVNYFRIQDGLWNVVGGNMGDIFEVEAGGGAGGQIIGGGGINDLKLVCSSSNSCNNKGSVQVDLVQRSLDINSGAGGKFQLDGVHRIFGTNARKEDIIPDCSTQLIVAGGNAENVRDTILFNKQCPQITTQNGDGGLQIVASGYFSLKSESAGHSFTIQVEPHMDNHQVNFAMVSTLEATSRKVVILQMAPSDLVAATYEIVSQVNYHSTLQFGRGQQVQFKLKRVGKVEKDHVSHISIVFGKIPPVVTQSLLLIDQNNGRPTVFHEMNTTSRQGHFDGAPALSNFFNLRKGQNIRATGGKEDDTFHLHPSFVNAQIFGRGGRNSLIVEQQGWEHHPLYFDLRPTATEGTVLARNIQVIRGRKHLAETIVCGCDTQLINGAGGNVHKADFVMIPGDLKCSNVDLMILVEPYTNISNAYKGQGSFTYAMSSDDKHIDITPPLHLSGAKYLYRFEADTHAIQFAKHAMRLHSTNESYNILKIQFKSGLKLELPMRPGQPATPELLDNPKVILEKGKDRLDFAVLQNTEETRVVATILVGDAGSQKLVHGISGAYNDISVRVGDQNSLGGIRGGEQDDKFTLHTVKNMRFLDGGSGERNHLELESNLRRSDDLVVDLREGSGSIKTKSNASVIDVLSNIQILSGRGDICRDVAFINCDTLLVGGFREVVVTQTNCSQETVTIIEIAEETSVYFHIPPENQFFQKFIHSKFHYKFNVIRSFTVKSEWWMDIRETEQVFHLAFALSKLDNIRYSSVPGKVVYSVDGNEGKYEHELDTYLDFEQEWFASPKLETVDGFQIKVSRQGEIFFAKSVPPWTEDEDNAKAEEVMQVAKRLGASFIIEGGQGQSNVFIYAGHQNTRNVLTTKTDARSLLCGGGSNATQYVVTDLVKDVKIYPGFYAVDEKQENTTEETTHLLDLTHVIFPIRENAKESNETEQMKYVPSVEERNGNLEIWMEGYELQFPGRVIIVNGVQHSEKLRVLLDTVVMRIDRDSVSLVRMKRSVGTWRLKPLPLILSEENPVAVMSLEDFELGQQIVFQGSSENDENIMANRTLNAEVGALRNGSEIVISNLMQVGPEMGQLRSLSFLIDTASMDTDNFTKMLAENVEVMIWSRNESKMMESGDNIFAFIQDGLPSHESSRDDWEDAMEKAEENLLENMPMVPRSFHIPLWRKAWKHYRYWVIGAMGAISLILVAVIVGLVYTYVIRWNYTWVPENARNAETKRNGKLKGKSYLQDGEKAHQHELKALFSEEKSETK